MGVTVFNPTKAPQHHGQVVVQPGEYQVIDAALIPSIRESQIPLRIEGDPDFVPLFVVCVPPI